MESNETAISQTIENKRITELPLNGRQVYMLLQLTAGTLFTQTTFGATGFSGTRAWDVNGSLTIHGSRTGNNEFLIEGAPSSGTGGGTGNWNYAPPVDAIEEFKVQTSSTDASYGRTSGGVVNMTLRSGTNQMRGSGHPAPPRDVARLEPDPEHPQQHLERGAQVLQRRSDAERADQPQQDVLHGRVSGLLREHPVPGHADDPDRPAAARRLLADVHRQRPAHRDLRPGDDAAERRPARGSFAIRSRTTGFRRHRWHPIARTLLQYFPRENATPSNLSGSDNFVNSPSVGRYRYNSYLTRIDHLFSDRHRLSLSNSANWGIEFRNENGLPEPSIRSDNYPTHRNHYLLTVEDNVTLSSSALWSMRGSWDRFDEPHDKIYGNIDPQLPFQGPYQLTGPPFVQISGLVAGQTMFPRTFRQPKNDAYSMQQFRLEGGGQRIS